MGSHIPYLCIIIILFVHHNYNKNKTQEVGSITLIFYNNKKWLHSSFNNTCTWFTELFPFVYLQQKAFNRKIKHPRDQVKELLRNITVSTKLNR